MISFLSYVFKVMLIVIFSTLFSLAIILLSQLFGQILQSSNTSVVASVILVSVVGNFVALLYQINNFIIILIMVGGSIYIHLFQERRTDLSDTLSFLYSNLLILVIS